MVNKTIQGTLHRGKACLRCRKRKMASLLLPRTIPFSISTLDSGVMALSQRANNA